VNRRTFLRMTGLAGGGLVLGVSTAGCADRHVMKMNELAATTGEFKPNVWLTITPENRVIVAVDKVEMGQGVFTSHAMLVAEELDFPIERIDPIHVTDPDFEYSIGEAGVETGGLGLQITGGSSSMAETFVPVRQAASSARGMLVAAAAEKWGVREGDLVVGGGYINHVASGRQAAYGDLTKEAARQEIAEPKLKRQGEFKVLGTEVGRVDARSKSDGSASYGTDVDVPDLVKAVVIHPPQLGGQVTKLTATKARGMRGVVDVFAFERGVAVVAKKHWQALAAARTVQVEWGPGDTAGFSTETLRAASLKRLGEPGTSIRDDGDVEAALARSDVKVVEGFYEVPYLAHATMEPQNCTAHVQEGRCTLWVPCQSATLAKEVAARCLGTSRSDVEVHTTMLGGGFGRRNSLDFVLEAVVLSRRMKRPVQVLWSREDDTRQGYYRPAAVTRMRGAVDTQGRPVALSYRSASQSLLVDQSAFVGGIFPEWIPLVARRWLTRAYLGVNLSGSLPDILATEGARDTPYAIENLSVEHVPIETPVPVSFWRSVGHSFNGFTMESFVDELAHLAGTDPVAFRTHLLKESPRHLAVLKKAAEVGGWGQPLPDGFGRGIAVHKSFSTYVAEVVEAGVVDGKIQVRKVVAVVDCGFAVNPDIVRAQVESAVIFGLSAALMQKITIQDGVVTQGNFDTYPALRMFQCPPIEVTVIQSSRKPTGIGEPGLPPVAAALGNALFDATGVRLRSLPFDAAALTKEDGQ
jgi:isoquinoline 1-oxidoreductase subunit beta